MATDEHKSTGEYTIGDIYEDPLSELDFEEEWGDPLETEHSSLDSVPDSAEIDFGNGVEREVTATYIIKRAMLDPDATVNPENV